MDPVPAEAVVAGGDGRSSDSKDEAPPEHAFEGRGVPSAVAGSPPDELDDEIAAAVEAGAPEMEELLFRLIEQPTTLGNEAGGQDLMREAFEALGLEPVEVPMDAEVLRAHPAAAPFDWDVDGKVNLVARWGRARGGRSLILNGHIDVVPVETEDGWTRLPFVPAREGDWIYGRGAADMKCGLAAIVGAVRGLQAVGLEPAGRVLLESVVEEECTGNGTLATVLAGYTADAAVLAEPFGAAITTSQVGVLWFHVRVRGEGSHAAEERRSANAIEASYDVMRALQGLEAELNESPPPPFDRFAHPINLNVGEIRGGGWASSTPDECVTTYRIAAYPGMRIRELQGRIEDLVAGVNFEGGAELPHSPEVRYSGYASEGYTIGDDHPLVSTLAASFAGHAGDPPTLIATTGGTDAAVLGTVGGTPAVCFGPYAERSHGPNERVSFPSVVQTAQVMASFIRTWCGVAD